MQIVPLSPNETIAASEMIERSFSKFVAPTFSEEGRQRFRSGIKADELRRRLTAGNIFFVAKSGHTITGLAEIRDGNHLNLLFVHPEYQSQGIGRSVLEAAIRSVKYKKITVNSSMNSVEVYSAMGFIATGVENESGGIRYVPMIRHLV